MSPSSSTPKMSPRSTKSLIFISLYAAVMTIGCSYFFVRDISKQLTLRNSIGFESLTYEEQFMPRQNENRDGNQSGKKREWDEDYYESRGKRRREKDINTRTDIDNEVTVTQPFPSGQHIVTHGHPRTATTLLFNMVAASYFLHLTHTDPDRIPSIHLQLWKREHAGDKILKREKETTYLLKTHLDLDNFKSDNTVFFTAAVDKAEAAETKQTLTNQGFKVAFIQDMESLKQNGISGLVSQYVKGYQLTDQDEAQLVEYFTQWEILRQCCGQQMSSKWRNDMMPDKYKRGDLPHHPTCANYDIDQVEQALISSELYSRIQKYPNIQPLNKPSLNDDALNGTYCSTYNHRVKTEGLSFFGTPGGRPVRSGLDWAIKNEFNHADDNLTPRGVQLFEGVKMRELWKRPEIEKKVWLKKVLRERIEKRGKSYKLGLEEVDDSLEFDFGRGGKEDNGDNEQDEESVDGDEDDDTDDDAGDTNNDQEADQLALSSLYKKTIITNPDLLPATTQNFDKTRAIFLISFGEEAATSTLVERCVLSLRRRGQYPGYIVVLTDAPSDRYEHVWDENVIVMHPRKEHLMNEDGSAMHYSKDNMSLKPKRFKTYVLDYVDMDERLNDVELIYYLDIDILAGDSLDGLFHGLESQYQITGHRTDNTSKLYFVTPLSKEWPFQSGTMIAERPSSRHCLSLWRQEIDTMLKTGRGRDQDALRNIHERILSNEETKCQLIRMENENYISFPTPRNFAQLSAEGARHANLIHISNSLFAKKIEEEEQNAYIHEVLMLNEEEVESGMYGKAVVRAKDTSR